MLRNDSDSQGGVINAGADMEKTLCTYIMQELLPPDCGIEINADDDLLGINHLDSMQFMRLVQFTEDTYALKIPPEDLLIENFQTVRRLTEYLSGRTANT